MSLHKIPRHIKAAPLLLSAALILASCGADKPAASVKDTDAAISVTPMPGPTREAEAKTDTAPPETSAPETEAAAADFSAEPAGKQPVTVDEIPSAFRLEVPSILQNPELPTGCESVALTMALMYEGFSLEKTTIADEYLVYTENDNLAEGYYGDPYSSSGAGCFPPALIKTADLYLDAQQSDLQGVDLTGVSLQDLFAYVAGDMPVIIWNTMYMEEPYFTGEEFSLNGITYRWYSTEHCVVLSGYDLDRGIVCTNDPLEGVVERNLSAFESYYDEIGRFAMVIQ